MIIPGNRKARRMRYSGVRPLQLLRVFLLLLSPTLHPVLAAVEAETGIPAYPDILLIGIESLRVDHSSAYGYSRATTPTLERLSSEGVLFRRAYASSGWTMPSVMSLFTGVVPSVHQTVSYRHEGLAEEITTLAAELRRNGFNTIGVTANPTTHRRYGFAKGFDHYDDLSIVRGVSPDALFNFSGTQVPYSQRTTGKEVTSFVLRALEERKRENPLFLHAFYFDPHYDYTPPLRYKDMFTNPSYSGSQDGRGIMKLHGIDLNSADLDQIIALYDAEIRYTDDQLARVIETLEATERGRRSLVVVFGDHGEEFWERGHPGHGRTLHEELVRVPLIVRWPGRLPEGLVIDEPVGLIDVMPMLLEGLGLAVPEPCSGINPLAGLATSGETQVPPRPPSPASERTLLMETQVYAPGFVAALSGRKKVIRRADGGGAMMFDLASDPRERQNLSNGPQASEFEPLVRALDGLPAGGRVPEAAKETSSPKLDPRLREALRSLGYVK